MSIDNGKFETSNESIVQFLCFNKLDATAEVRIKTVERGDGTKDIGKIVFYTFAIPESKKRELLDAFYSQAITLTSDRDRGAWGRDYHEAFKKVKTLRIKAWKEFKKQQRNEETNNVE